MSQEAEEVLFQVEDFEFPQDIQALHDLFYFMDARFLFMLYQKVKKAIVPLKCFELIDLQEKQDQKQKHRKKKEKKKANKSSSAPQTSKEKKKKDEEDEDEDEEFEIELDDEELKKELQGLDLDFSEDSVPEPESATPSSSSVPKTIHFQSNVANKIRSKYFSHFWSKISKKAKVGSVLESPSSGHKQIKAGLQDIPFEPNSFSNSYLTTQIHECIDMLHMSTLQAKTSLSSRQLQKEEVKQYLFQWSRCWIPCAHTPPLVYQIRLEPYVLCSSLSPNQAWISSYSITHGFRIFKQDNGMSLPWCYEKKAQNPIQTFQQTTCIQFSPNSSCVCQGTSNGSVFVWNLAKASVSFVFRAWHQKAITCMDVCLKNQYYLVGSLDTTVSLWEPSHTLPLRLFIHTSALRQVSFHPSMKFMGSLDSQGVFSFWSIESGKLLCQWSLEDPITSFCFTGPTFSQVAFIHSNKGTLALFSLTHQRKKIAQYSFESFLFEGVSIRQARVFSLHHQHQKPVLSVVWQQDLVYPQSRLCFDLIDFEDPKNPQPLYKSNSFSFSNSFRQIVHSSLSWRNAHTVLTI